MAGPIRIAILANGSQARRELTATQATLGKFASVGKRAATLGFGALAFGAASFVKSSISAEKTYSTSMRLIQATTKASSDEIGKMNNLALKLGADTSFGAQDAADAMLELAKAGLKTSTIMKGGVQGTLTLAAAGGLELGNAATIAANAMQTFNLRGRDMDSIAAALAGGANASTASVESLGQALQQVGPGAINAGFSLQETVAALAAFDAAGIKGSDAGTSLKTMLSRLVPMTTRAKNAMADANLDFTDAEGNFDSLTTIAGKLQRSLGDLSEEERTRALTTIFGSDATRAATVLMKNGTKGIRGYVKATKDQNAAQELAEARLSGTEGALERLDGAVETAKLRLGQELAPVVVKVADALGDKLVPGIEGGIDAAKKIGKALAPAAKEIAEAISDLVKSGDGAGDMFNDVLIPALELAADVVGGLVGFVNDLPGPVKEIGIQAGLAALVLPRLSSGIVAVSSSMSTGIARAKQYQAEMTYTATRTQNASAAMTRMAGAAKTAAGIGGLLLLYQSTKTSNKGLSVLMSTLGGAGLGAAGGPWGIAIGAAAGLTTGLLSLKDGTDTAAASMEIAKAKASAYADTLDQITGAAKAATRESVALSLQQSGALDLARTLGLSTQDLTKSLLGNEDATNRIRYALESAVGAMSLHDDALLRGVDYGDEKLKKDQQLADAAQQLANILGLEGDALSAATDDTRELSVASGKLTRALKGVKDRARIVARVEQRGWPETQRAAGRLLRGLVDVNNKSQLKVAVRALGFKPTEANLRAIRKAMRDVGREQPDTGPFNRSLEGGLRKGKGAVDRGGKDIKRSLRDSGKTPVDNGWLDSLTRSLTTGKGKASSGGREIGGNLKSGFLSGIGGLEALLSGEVTRAVNGAIAAGRIAAQTASPSRKTMKLGKDMQDGLVIGFSKGNAPEKAAKSLVRRILAGIGRDRIGEVKGSLDKLDQLIQKTLTKRFKGEKNAEKKTREAAKRAKKLLADETAAIVRNAKKRERIYKKLEKAQAKLRDLRQQKADYAKSVKDAALEFASITNLDTAFNADAMIKGMQKRLEKLKLFTDTIKRLAASGLNATTISQLVNAGVEGGLAEALALLQGGQGAIDQFNQLQEQIDQVAGQLGKTASEEMYDAGIAAAQGIVKGLESQGKALEKIAQKLARDLVKALKKELGIKSPSVVFRDLGKLTAQGLTIGLEDVHVRRAGQKLAGDLIDGYGRPQLAAATMKTFAVGPVPGGPAPVRITLTAEQLSRIQRGREIQIDLDAYYAAGGKPPSR